MPATWQAGDSAPPIRFTLSEGGAALDLIDITVKLRFAPKGGTTTWERACEIDDAAVGTCHLDWAEGDLARSGDYEGQLILEYADSTRRLSAPFDIVVARSLAEVET